MAVGEADDADKPNVAVNGLLTLEQLQLSDARMACFGGRDGQAARARRSAKRLLSASGVAQVFIADRQHPV